MLRVAIDTGPLHGVRTGVGRAVAETVAEFRRRQERIEVIPYVVSRRARLQPGERRLPYPAAFALSAWSRVDHPRADRHLRPAAVLHGMNYVVPPARIPRVVSVYDTWALRNPHSCSPAVSRSMDVLRRNVHSGAVIHASSHATARDLAEIFPLARIHVVHLGGPTFRDRSATDAAPCDIGTLIGSDGPYVLAVGTVEKRKNFPMLVRAYAATRAARSGIRLVIAGSPGDDSTTLAAAVSGLDPEKRRSILVLGRVGDDELETLYRHAQIVAYPSLDEGFGFPVLEAMSLGVPVIASNRGSIPEVAGDAAELVDPMDPDAIAAGLDLLLSDSARRRDLVESGRERCRRFSWKAAADGLIQLYESLADG